MSTAAHHPHATRAGLVAELYRIGYDRRTAVQYGRRKWGRWNAGMVGSESAVCPWCRCAIPGGTANEKAHFAWEVELEELKKWAGIVSEELERDTGSARPIFEDHPPIDPPE